MFTFEGIFPKVKRRREKKNRLCLDPRLLVVYRSHGGHACSDDITTLQRRIIVILIERWKARASMNNLVRSFFPKSPAKGTR